MNPDDSEFAETVRAFSGGEKLLNRYKLNRVLGQGGMGVVWLARDEELDRDVAMKFLPAIVVNDRASLNDLKRETKRSLELTHPNIVRTYDFVQDKTLAGISMEYVDGDTLRNRRLDQPSQVFETAQLGEWMRQLCGALDYAHLQAAIVHRDLKPANLMVNGKGQIRVADFGISRSLADSVSQMSAQRGISGTLVYMSPQQLTGEDSSSLDDIYALGATLYELLTSKPPFFSGDIAGQAHGKVPASLAERRASFGISAGPISENWESTVAACLAKEPEKRPQSAGEVAARLGLTTAASLPPPSVFNEPPTQYAGTIAAVPPKTPTAANVSVTAPLKRAEAPPPIPPVVLAPVTVPPHRGRPRSLLWAGVAAAAMVVIGAAIWFSPPSKPGRPTGAAQRTGDEERAASSSGDERSPAGNAPANPRGGLLVKTEPAGAMIKVGDGAPLRSPAVFQDLKPGTYSVEISSEGYDPVILSGVVADRQITDAGSVKLQRSKGRLQITSTPAGLAYELKSKANPLLSTRGTTPADAAEMPAGDYEITVTREGWPAQTQTVAVARDEERSAVFEFVGGRVTIQSEPTGARVVSGTQEMGVTPLVLNDVAPGEVQYTLSLAGREPATVKGTIASGQETALRAELPRTAAAKKPRTTTTATTTRKKSNDDDGDSRSSGHSHTGEILRGIFGGGFRRPF